MSSEFSSPESVEGTVRAQASPPGPAEQLLLALRGPGFLRPSDIAAIEAALLEQRRLGRADQQAAGLTFDELRDTNKARCEAAFHRVDEWKPWEWSNAMAGECGEACNITKKMARIWPANQFKQNWNKPEDQRLAELESKLADELADVVIYADLLATRIGRSLGECVRHKFNEKSDEIGSSIKLAVESLPSPPLPSGTRQQKETND